MFNNTPKSPKVFKIIRVFAIWVLFIPLAILNGAVREKVLIPLLGMQFALPLSGILLSGIRCGSVDPG